MGFVSGFTGGVTLTLGVAYLTVLTHERNRNSQALYLRSQSQLLTPNHDLQLQPPPQSRAEIARTSRATFAETAKDRWNEEVENVVRRVQSTEWNNVRGGMEGAISRFLGKGLEQSQGVIEEVEELAGQKGREAVDTSKAIASRVADRTAGSAKVGADRAAAKTREDVDIVGVKAHELGSAAKGKADSTTADARVGVDHAAALQNGAWDREVERSQELKERAMNDLRNPSGTVDAARGVVRDAFSKGIEKGQELIGKAQAAVGLATETICSTVEEKIEGISQVDRALTKRYEQLHGLDKTVEEALEARYKPLDEKF